MAGRGARWSSEWTAVTCELRTLRSCVLVVLGPGPAWPAAGPLSRTKPFEIESLGLGFGQMMHVWSHLSGARRSATPTGRTRHNAQGTNTSRVHAPPKAKLPYPAPFVPTCRAKSGECGRGYPTPVRGLTRCVCVHSNWTLLPSAVPWHALAHAHSPRQVLDTARGGCNEECISTSWGCQEQKALRWHLPAQREKSCSGFTQFARIEGIAAAMRLTQTNEITSSAST
eukprot:2848196-Prymnesium_polylepis.1